MPAGASYNSDGTVNQENSELKGNQFVWIPCGTRDYAKVNFGMQNSTGWDTSTKTGELVPIEKYSGFYVGRYEAGTSEVTLSGNVKWENASTGSSNSQGWGWQNQSFTSSKVLKSHFILLNALYTKSAVLCFPAAYPIISRLYKSMIKQI